MTINAPKYGTDSKTRFALEARLVEYAFMYAKDRGADPHMLAFTAAHLLKTNPDMSVAEAFLLEAHSWSGGLDPQARLKSLKQPSKKSRR